MGCFYVNKVLLFIYKHSFNVLATIQVFMASQSHQCSDLCYFPSIDKGPCYYHRRKLDLINRLSNAKARHPETVSALQEERNLVKAKLLLGKFATSAKKEVMPEYSKPSRGAPLKAKRKPVQSVPPPVTPAPTVTMRASVSKTEGMVKEVTERKSFSKTEKKVTENVQKEITRENVEHLDGTKTTTETERSQTLRQIESTKIKMTLERSQKSFVFSKSEKAFSVCFGPAARAFVTDHCFHRSYKLSGLPQEGFYKYRDRPLAEALDLAKTEWAALVAMLSQKAPYPPLDDDWSRQSCMDILHVFNDRCRLIKKHYPHLAILYRTVQGYVMNAFKIFRIEMDLTVKIVVPHFSPTLVDVMLNFGEWPTERILQKFPAKLSGVKKTDGTQSFATAQEVKKTKSLFLFIVSF